MSADAELAWCAFAVHASVLRRSPPGVRERLRVLSDRWRGAEAAELRRRPIPQAYRRLARQLGIEPDERRIGIEAYVADRVVHGAFRSHGLLADALLIATVETGVGVWALDADRLAAGRGEGGPDRRAAGRGEGAPDPRAAGRGEGGPDRLAAGRGEGAAGAGAAGLRRAGRDIVAEAGVVARVFEPPEAEWAVGAATRRVGLYAVVAPLVPAAAVDEALWTARSVIDSG